MALDRRALAIIGAGLMIVACILFIVSNALPTWGTAGSGSLKETIGLWRGCTPIFGQSVCGNLVCTNTNTAQCAKMMTARAFITIACILSALAALFLLACAAISSTNRAMILAAKSVPFASLVAGIIGLALGIAFITYGSAFSLGAAAIVAIVAVVINLAGAIVAVPFH